MRRKGGGKDGRGRMEEGDNEREVGVVWGHHRSGLLVPVLITVPGCGGVLIIVHAWVVVGIHASMWPLTLSVLGWLWSSMCHHGCSLLCGALLVVDGVCCGHSSLSMFVFMWLCH